jgi:YD repeat-containing protein
MTALVELALSSVSQNKNRLSYRSPRTLPEPLQKAKYHCCPQTKNETAFSFKNSLLRLLLFIGLFYQAVHPLCLMTSAQNKTGTCSYTYGDNGLLVLKQTPAGTTTLTRDGYGNITTAKLPDGSMESLSWKGGQKLASYSIVGTQNETRSYGYDTRGQFLNAERYLLRERRWTFNEVISSWIPPTK